MPPFETASVPLIVESVDVATHVGTPPTSARTKPLLLVPKSVEVATTVGTPEAPEEFASTLFAAMDESPIVAFDPPMSAPAPAESVMPLLLESEVVAMLETFAPPLLITI